jgi:hypothetical protein
VTPSSDSSSTDTIPSSQEHLFPAGSWSFTTALTAVSTDCTSNPATFSCFPGSVYSAGAPNASAALWHWTITPLNSYAYAISSSANPFAPVFDNVPLTLVDGNQYTERLVFNFTLALPTVPAIDLVPGQHSAATCTFRTTVLSATLWTRTRADYPASIAAVPEPKEASTNFAPWPFQVDIAEVQAPGAGVPECVDTRGATLGDFSRAGGGSCGCWYANFDLERRTKGARRRWNG